MLKALYHKIETAAKSAPNDSEVISFYTIRKAVGWIGILIPVVLITTGYFFGDCHIVQPSISHYYYTNARELFVGALCAVSLFMFCYKGHSRIDNISANMAGFFALLVALFPTNISCLTKNADGSCADATTYFPCQTYIASLTDIPYSGTIHLVAAAAFFLTLSFMSLFLFTLSNKPRHLQDAAKRRRNNVYVVCGIIMVASIAAIAINFAFGNREEENQFTLICEAIALLAFGISWLTKGEAILGDKGKAK
ncbi:hypothetical protein CAP35_13270 [Chitinophagaceae bacterium IBVUCB1]|nr:hypothetical protein CAP35_13270 [Chitinophagaceae bacterium IBVUCB1]